LARSPTPLKLRGTRARHSDPRPPHRSSSFFFLSQVFLKWYEAVGARAKFLGLENKEKGGMI